MMLLVGAVIFLQLFVPPATPESEIPWSEWLRPFGLGVVIAALAYAVVVALFFSVLRKIVPPSRWLARMLDAPWLQPLQLMPQGLEAAAERTYAPLLQQLNLRPDQRAQLEDLVRRRIRAWVRASMLLLNRGLDAARRTDLMRETQREIDGFTARIKERLGQEQYAAFRQFEKSVPDRMLIDRLNQDLAKTSTALGPQQQARLLQALADARAQYPWTTELSRRNFETFDYTAQLNDEDLDNFAREEEQFDRLFLTQLRPLLSPPQVTAFQKLQQHLRQSRLVDFKMAAKLYALERRSP